MQKIKTMVRQRPTNEDGGVSPGTGSGSGGLQRSQTVLSGPMAGQLVSPEEDDEETVSRGRHREEDEDDEEGMFGGMSPEREMGHVPPPGRAGGYGQRL
jgi:hypothetical protein